ncbi:hypothetical protein HHX47_DHR4001048 [Lentinula edodes]|nr:hypothetical protein HHX47_DHR4001048 [Lentinula edodes]
MSGTPPATSEHFYLPPLARAAHAGHVKRCLLGLPDSQVDLDSGRCSSRLVVFVGRSTISQNGDRVLLLRKLGSTQDVTRQDIADRSRVLERMDMGAANAYGWITQSLSIMLIKTVQAGSMDQASGLVLSWQARCLLRGVAMKYSALQTDMDPNTQTARYTDYDTPHIIMTYTALLTLAILRDDFSRLEKQGILLLLKACQRKDGR